jgi:hypothetical protein
VDCILLVKRPFIDGRYCSSTGLPESKAFRAVCQKLMAIDNGGTTCYQMVIFRFQFSASVSPYFWDISPIRSEVTMYEIVEFVKPFGWSGDFREKRGFYFLRKLNHFYSNLVDRGIFVAYIYITFFLPLEVDS